MGASFSSTEIKPSSLQIPVSNLPLSLRDHRYLFQYRLTKTNQSHIQTTNFLTNTIQNISTDLNVSPTRMKLEKLSTVCSTTGPRTPVPGTMQSSRSPACTCLYHSNPAKPHLQSSRNTQCKVTKNGDIRGKMCMGAPSPQFKSQDSAKYAANSGDVSFRRFVLKHNRSNTQRWKWNPHVRSGPIDFRKEKSREE